MYVLAIFSAEVHIYQKMKTVSNNTTKTTSSSSGRGKCEVPRACLSIILCGLRSYGKNAVFMRTKLNKIRRLKLDRTGTRIITYKIVFFYTSCAMTLY